MEKREIKKKMQRKAEERKEWRREEKNAKKREEKQRETLSLSHTHTLLHTDMYISFSTPIDLLFHMHVRCVSTCTLLPNKSQTSAAPAIFIFKRMYAAWL